MSAYVECARSALLEMWRQVGPLVMDAEGMAVRGVICRLLILPGLAHEACASLAGFNMPPRGLTDKHVER